jgi:ATP-dependent exoDNAse (exonuclease V) beta subunit
MSKLIVYKASAGSGKTYRLAAEYIKQLVKNPESYKSILAVTFTNKATAEMKGRILNELFNISKGEQSGIGSEAAKEIGLNNSELRTRAQQSLSLILHDYSRFSISTIDSFVQRVIQALLWEIGEQGGVDIELDNVPVLEHAADNLLDSAATIDELLKWLTAMGYAQLDEGKSWDVRHKLVELGKQLFSEKFRLMSQEDVEKFTDRERVNLLKFKLSKLTNDTLTEVKAMGTSVFEELKNRSIAPESFTYGFNGVMGYFRKIAQIDSSADELPLPDGQRVQKAMNDTTGQDWVSKSTYQNKVEFDPLGNVIHEVLHPSLVKIAELVNHRNAEYISAKLILKNLENLALIGDLWTKVRELSREEGFLLLSDSGHLLKEFVKEWDAPFVYEKVGTRYDMYMIDEFQDTSEVQWHNFRPLIENSLSQDFFSMIVGDVKQSIYRWRNGDWSILASGVASDFAHYGTNEIALKTNWRSQKSIIDFNNSFFSQAKDVAIQQLEAKASEPSNSEVIATLKEQVNKAYSDVEQKANETSNEKLGYVEFNLFEYKKNSDRDETLSHHIPKLINDLQNRYKLSDIAILVRTKSDGQRIASMLLEHNRAEPNQTKQIAFVSQEGLQLKTSLVVRLTLAALRLVQDPSNAIAKRVLAKELATLNITDSTSWHTHFTTEVTNAEADWLSSLNTRPLQEVFEAIAQRYNLFSVKGELAHLAELHENIAAQGSKGGSDVNRFLQWWDEHGEGLSLSVPGSNNAVSILTIHKSKGLQFPVVLVPYAGWDFRGKAYQPLLWVSSTQEPFDLLPKYPIQASGKASKSLFALDVLEEEMKEIVDNINLLYVAFTRPEKELYVYVPLTKSEMDNIPDSINSTSKLIRSIVPKIDILQNASVEDSELRTYFTGKKLVEPFHQQTNNREQNQWIIDTYPVGNSFRGIKLKFESEEFFMSEPNERLAPMEHGKVMHELFSNIQSKNDIDNALHRALVDGIIDNETSQALKQKITETLSQQPFVSWFSGGWDVKNEKSILTPNGHSYRPDRVMASPTNTIVVDFKFGGEMPSYAKQVLQYMALLNDMGYQKVEGYIWYVDIGKLVSV